MVLTVALSGCASARFYPVQGPLSTQKPVPVLKGTISGPFFSGSMRVKMPGGEMCTGHWERVQHDAGQTARPQDARATAEMADLWNNLYGHNFYQDKVKGSLMYSRGVLTGTAGTTIDVEFYQAPVDARDPVRERVEAIMGVGKDNKGNAYKISLL
jgi:hypothetical protein